MHKTSIVLAALYTESMAIIALIIAFVLLILHYSWNKKKSGNFLTNLLGVLLIAFVLVFLVKGCMSSGSSIMDPPSRQ